MAYTSISHFKLKTLFPYPYLNLKSNNMCYSHSYFSVQCTSLLAINYFCPIYIYFLIEMTAVCTHKAFACMYSL